MRKDYDSQLPKEIRDVPVLSDRLERLRRFRYTPRQTAHMIEKHVFGQTEAVRTLACALHAHVAVAQKLIEGEEPPRLGPVSRILMLGPSGVGKTHIARTLGRITSLSVQIADAANITETGYVGNSPDDVVFGLIKSSLNNRPLSRVGIVVLDEIDKLRCQEAPGSHDVGGRGAAEALLTLLDGGDMTIKAYAERTLAWSEGFSAANLMVLGCGAFPGLDAIIANRLRGGKRLGFGTGNAVEPDATPNLLSQVTAEDLISYGFAPEFVGRFGIIQPLNPLPLNTRLAILRDAPEGPVKTLQQIAESAGFQLRFTRGLLERIAAMSETSPLGIRSMFGAVHRCAEKALFEVPEQLRRSRYCVAQVTLGIEALENGAYTLRWGSRQERVADPEPDDELEAYEDFPEDEPRDFLEA